MIDRYVAIQTILGKVQDDDLVLSTTGMISREVFFSEDRAANFYMIGSMGLLSSFGLGLALQSPVTKRPKRAKRKNKKLFNRRQKALNLDYRIRKWE